jgi:hypothetical protein
MKQEEKHKKPEAIMAQLFQRHFVSEEVRVFASRF